MKQTEAKQGPDKFAAFVGIDWGDSEHQVLVEDVETGKRKSHTLKQRPDALSDWASKLRECYQGRSVAVAIEQTKGALINFLLEYDFFVIFPVHPKTSAKYREAFASSGAKDDPTDAELLLDILTRHRDKLRPWRPDDEQTRKIIILSRKRRETIGLRVQLAHQLKAILKQYYPLALEVAGDDLGSALACRFLLRWSSLEELQRARESTVRDFYTKYGLRRRDVIQKRLATIKQAQPLTTDKAIIETSILEARMLASLLLELVGHIKGYDKQLDDLYPKHPDAIIFSSFPGAGPVYAPRLLAAFGADRERYENASEVQMYSGVAPVTKRSGKTCLVHWRWACPKFIRQSFHEYAGESRNHSVWAAAYYRMQIKKGKSHNTVVRALAFKWIRIMFRCWQERKPYDELAYIKSLQKHGSQLFKHLIPEEA